MNIHAKINQKGRDQQELNYLFPGLYGDKALTKRERGAWRHLETYLKRKHKQEIKLRIY